MVGGDFNSRSTQELFKKQILVGDRICIPVGAYYTNKGRPAGPAPVHAAQITREAAQNDSASKAKTGMLSIETKPPVSLITAKRADSSPPPTNFKVKRRASLDSSSHGSEFKRKKRSNESEHRDTNENENTRRERDSMRRNLVYCGTEELYESPIKPDLPRHESSTHSRAKPTTSTSGGGSRAGMTISLAEPSSARSPSVFTDESDTTPSPPSSPPRSFPRQAFDPQKDCTWNQDYVPEPAAIRPVKTAAHSRARRHVDRSSPADLDALLDRKLDHAKRRQVVGVTIPKRPTSESDAKSQIDDAKSQIDDADDEDTLPSIENAADDVSAAPELHNLMPSSELGSRLDSSRESSPGIGPFRPLCVQSIAALKLNSTCQPVEGPLQTQTERLDQHLTDAITTSLPAGDAESLRDIIQLVDKHVADLAARQTLRQHLMSHTNLQSASPRVQSNSQGVTTTTRASTEFNDQSVPVQEALDQITGVYTSPLSQRQTTIDVPVGAADQSEHSGIKHESDVVDLTMSDDDEPIPRRPLPSSADVRRTEIQVPNAIAVTQVSWSSGSTPKLSVFDNFLGVPIAGPRWTHVYVVYSGHTMGV
ncbi:hypothetical protein C1H76_5031 [Elsinoe australis]|uniref:Uncharacterized protein n=1 Tax=Elsinoe australis TaxID=40998 RepID=A0A4U7B3N3_9PEZI|nr:hypothetical protein C1H76_5031 [Elsinoe australis]